MAQSAQSPQNPKILLIDDEEDIANLFAKSLRWAGYQMQCHYVGQGTWEIIQEFKPDLVLLD